MLALAGCHGFTARPPATPACRPASLPAACQSASVAEFEPDKGGVMALEDGALLTLPPQALPAKSRVSFEVNIASPVVPVPRSLVGRAYEFGLDRGGADRGRSCALPLPAEVTASQYDIAPYRWNGKTWERVNGRATADGIQFGAGRPGIYALQGQWTAADATLALTKPETPPGQQTTPLVAVGQYRYSILPALTRGIRPGAPDAETGHLGGRGSHHGR